MSNCSATFCSACLLHQCDITAQLNPNATLTFLYNASQSIDLSTVGSTHMSHKRRQVAAITVCPNDMVSFWKLKKRLRRITVAHIDIPNKKKVS